MSEEHTAEKDAGGCTPCLTCGGDQSRGWHLHDRAATDRADENEYLLSMAVAARDRAERHAEALESEVERVSNERDDYRTSADSAEAEVERLRSALGGTQ